MIIGPYFMFPETRQALIAESERRRRAAAERRTQVDWRATESQLRELKAFDATPAKPTKASL